MLGNVVKSEISCAKSSGRVIVTLHVDKCKIQIFGRWKFYLSLLSLNQIYFSQELDMMILVGPFQLGIFMGHFWLLLNTDSVSGLPVATPCFVSSFRTGGISSHAHLALVSLTCVHFS